jgi:hypothetical protein
MPSLVANKKDYSASSKVPGDDGSLASLALAVCLQFRRSPRDFCISAF